MARNIVAVTQPDLVTEKVLITLDLHCSSLELLGQARLPDTVDEKNLFSKLVEINMQNKLIALNFRSHSVSGVESNYTFYLDGQDFTSLGKVRALFEDAMDQHERRTPSEATRKIVAICLNFLHFVNDSVEEFYDEAFIFNRMSYLINSKIEYYTTELKRSSKWHNCHGVLLCFTLPSFLDKSKPNVHVVWPRVRHWISPTGGKAVDELPSMIHQL